MDVGPLLEMLALAVPVIGIILKILGSLVVVAQSLVPIFPAKSNQEGWEKIKKIPVLGSLLVSLMAFSVVQKK